MGRFLCPALHPGFEMRGGCVVIEVSMVVVGRTTRGLLFTPLAMYRLVF